MSRNTLLAAALVIAAVAVTIAGCSGASKNDDLLSGADIFDPARFSLAIYDVTLSDGSTTSHQGFIVASNTSGRTGDVLTSIAFHDLQSTRADALISRDRKKTLDVQMTDVNDTAVQISGGSLLFNMTTVDQSWNALETQYGHFGSANVTVPAGSFADCKVYVATKTLSFGGRQVSVQVNYYIHPSSPVPVMFEVKGPGDTYTYRLERVYLPGDTASTPERAVQSFFDAVDTGRQSDALKYLVAYDAGSSGYRPAGNAAGREFLANLSDNYLAGRAGYRLQFVDVVSADPGRSGDLRTVSWNSINYEFATLNVYRRSGSFDMVPVDGQWRIII